MEPPPASATPSSAALSANTGARARGRLTGYTPVVGHATLQLSNTTFHWADATGAPLSPEAGSGIAAAIADLVLGTPEHPHPHSEHGSPPHPRERAIPVDQTHTSVIVDEKWVVKIVRHWGNADRATNVLTRINQAAPDVTAAFGGSLSWHHPDHGHTTVAIVTEYVPHTTDGWKWAPDDVATHLRDGAPSPTFPTELGTLTAQVHLALRSPAHPNSAADPRAQAPAHALQLAQHVFADPPASTPKSHWSPADQRLHNRSTRLQAALQTIPHHSDTPLITPHGDLHLGQFLRTPQGRLVLLDFDGDPQWDTARQQQLDGAARDLAHLIVSLYMVGAVAQRRLGAADTRATAWACDAHDQFLTAYRAATPTEFADEHALPGLIAEQLLAEVQYARHYLPEWRYAGDGALTALYPSHASDQKDPPWNPPALPTISPASRTPSPASQTH